MKATPEQYKQWIEFQENNKGGFNKLSKALEYAKMLGINEKSNCKNCGDIETPDWETIGALFFRILRLKLLNQNLIILTL